MRKFAEGIVEWKTNAALMFSASVVVCAVIMKFTGNDSIPFTVLVSLLIISAIGTFLQHLAFTDRIIKKMRYTTRMIIFFLPFLALLMANAWYFFWFPIEDTTHWLIISGIYLVVFIGGTVSFEIYFHAMGIKYDGLLGQYRKQRELEGK